MFITEMKELVLQRVAYVLTYPSQGIQDEVNVEVLALLRAVTALLPGLIEENCSQVDRT